MKNITITVHDDAHADQILATLSDANKAGDLNFRFNTHVDKVGEPRVAFVVMVPNHWGRGATLAEAWQRVAKTAHRSVTQLRKGEWASFVTNDLTIEINEMGDWVHRRGAFIEMIDWKK